MKKCILLIPFFFILSGTVSPILAKDVLFQWKFNMGESLYMEKYSRQTIIKDGLVVRQRDIKDIDVLSPTRIEPGNYYLEGQYRSYIKDAGENTNAYALEEEEPLVFAISNNGIYTMPPDQYLPNIRNIPLFPRKAVKAGDMWTATGIEAFSFNPPIEAPVVVAYQYQGIEKQMNRDCARLSFSYTINHLNKIKNEEIPYKYAGYSYTTFWYDVKNNVPVYQENVYDIIMFYRNGTIIEYRGDLTGTYEVRKNVTAREKRGLRDRIEKEIGPSQNVTIRTNDKGVIISLGEIFFDFDSARLKPDLMKDLDKISQILKQNSKFEVIIEGHTDTTGNEEYNLRLSTDRARNTLNYFIEKKCIQPDQASYVGKGESSPAYPNDTSNNRKRNRRVDVIIKQE